VSTTDIELDDNYALARSVATITKADMILIKMDQNSKFILQPRGKLKAKLVEDETQLFSELEKMCIEINGTKGSSTSFPLSIQEIIVN
jgi:glutamate 5-kinase